ncbi:unnamed protein product [Paramecium primaurelia]|uniref:Uncharacterized protein n=1 Tax=Paramecium primaurelia TaxID=5886 RepID=A0A8S1JZR2_PARPR|nr:unnamed protein product [Paramecium primaurelia]
MPQVPKNASICLKVLERVSSSFSIIPLLFILLAALLPYQKLKQFFFPYCTNLTQKFNCESDSFVLKRKKLFQTKQAKFIFFPKFQYGHTSYVMSVYFSPDGNTLASGSYDKSIRLWDVKTGQEIKSSDKNYKDILAQFKIAPQKNSQLQKPPITSLPF